MKNKKVDIEREYGSSISFVIQKYTVDLMSTKQIADLTGITKPRIIRILKKYGVRIRGRSEAAQLMIKRENYVAPHQGKTFTDEHKLNLSLSLKKNHEGKTEEEAIQRTKNANEARKEPEAQKRKQKALLQAKHLGSKLERFLVTKLQEAGYIVKHRRKIVGEEKSDWVGIDILVECARVGISVDGQLSQVPILDMKHTENYAKETENRKVLLPDDGYSLIILKCEFARLTNMERYGILALIKRWLDNLKRADTPQIVTVAYGTDYVEETIE